MFVCVCILLHLFTTHLYTTTQVVNSLLVLPYIYLDCCGCIMFAFHFFILCFVCFVFHGRSMFLSVRYNYATNIHLQRKCITVYVYKDR